jgi:hypothetical protein
MVETRRFQAMGQLQAVDSTCTAPPGLSAVDNLRHLRVVVQVEFEIKVLKPVFHFTGSRFEETIQAINTFG